MVDNMVVPFIIGASIFFVCYSLWLNNDELKNWLKAFPMPDGSESGHLMPGLLVFIFAILVILDLFLFAIYITSG